jgi:hypothetical protein
MQNEDQNQQIYNEEQVDPYASTALQQENPEVDNEPTSLSWTASEFIQHDKSAIWYLSLAGLTVAFALLAYFLLNKDIFSLVVILMLGFVFGVSAARKPRILKYTVDDHGLLIDAKEYDYEGFRSFSVIDEGPIFMLVLMPVQRFSPILTIYVPEDTIDAVVDTVGAYLPVVQHQPSLVDKFLSRIRF